MFLLLSLSRRLLVSLPPWRRLMPRVLSNSAPSINPPKPSSSSSLITTCSRRLCRAWKSVGTLSYIILLEHIAPPPSPKQTKGQKIPLFCIDTKKMPLGKLSKVQIAKGFEVSHIVYTDVTIQVYKLYNVYLNIKFVAYIVGS